MERFVILRYGVKLFISGLKSKLRPSPHVHVFKTEFFLLRLKNCVHSKKQGIKRCQKHAKPTGGNVTLTINRVGQSEAWTLMSNKGDSGTLRIPMSYAKSLVAPSTRH